MEVIVEGRILKRHHFSKHMIFYDIVVAPKCFQMTVDAFASSEKEYTFVSVSVQRNNDMETFPKAVVGDVIRAKGNAHNQNEFLARTQRLSLDVSVHDIEVVDSFTSLDASEIKSSITNGSFFTFDKQKMGAEFQTYDLVELPLPTMAIQVGLKQLERFIVAFRDMFGNTFEMRESSTGYSNSSDRLLIFRAKTQQEANFDLQSLVTLYKTTVSNLTNDSTLGPAVLRLYPGNCGVETLSFCSTRLETVVQNLNRQISSDSSFILRLQCYPRAVMNQVLAVDAAQQVHLPLHPTQFTHVAYIYLCDGVWIVSMVPRAECFIGDLREKKPMPSSKLAVSSYANNTAGSSDVQNVTICRAGAKIEEIMRRKHWIFDDESNSLLHKYQLAMDVGASPGGWSYFLATQVDVERVIAVDKGELRLPEPWPKHLFYWQILGEDAVSYLYHLCCNRFEAQHGSAETEENKISKVVATPPPRATQQQWDDSKLFESNNNQDFYARKIDLYCSDANIPPTATTAILLQCVQNSLLAKDARVILTFKNPYGKKEAWKESVRESLHQLEAAGFAEIEEIHLLANTAKETTITAIYRQ